MLNLRKEQEDMRARWSSPEYRWVNDSEIRKRYAKEFRKHVLQQRADDADKQNAENGRDPVSS